MKTAITMLTGLSLALLFSVSATAEPFNERGELFTATAPVGSPQPAEPVRATPIPFIERGEYFTATAPVGSLAPREPVEARPTAFNQRGHYELIQ